MLSQVNRMMSSAWLNLKNVSYIRTFLTPEATSTIVLYWCQLDTYNCKLAGIQALHLNKLQRVQNTAEK